VSTDLLDIIAAEDLRNTGMERASLAEPAEWTRAAERVIAEFVAAGRPFSSDNVRARIGPPLHKNAMGAVFKHAVESGKLRRDGMVQSKRVLARGRWIAQYRGVR
jgi:hypothetical protein